MWMDLLLWAHSVEGLSTNINFLNDLSVSKVLEAVIWKTNSVFTSVYL